MPNILIVSLWFCGKPIIFHDFVNYNEIYRKNLTRPSGNLSELHRNLTEVRPNLRDERRTLTELRCTLIWQPRTLLRYAALWFVHPAPLVSYAATWLSYDGRTKTELRRVLTELRRTLTEVRGIPWLRYAAPLLGYAAFCIHRDLTAFLSKYDHHICSILGNDLTVLCSVLKTLFVVRLLIQEGEGRMKKIARLLHINTVYEGGGA
jgi:hypothetical protein